jgi:hypothetical protein
MHRPWRLPFAECLGRTHAAAVAAWRQRCNSACTAATTQQRSTVSGHAELAPQNFGGPSPRTTPPMAPQIKQQNRGFLNFGSFLWRAACSRGVGARARPLARRISCTEFGIGSTFRHHKFCSYCLFTLRISECASCPFILS